jgi:hypothetical protein
MPLDLVALAHQPYVYFAAGTHAKEAPRQHLYDLAVAVALHKRVDGF